MTRPARNANRPVKMVCHAELARVDLSLFRSECPECDEGVLMMRRHPTTLRLLREDICLLCGQRFMYAGLLPGQESTRKLRRKK